MTFRFCLEPSRAVRRRQRGNAIPQGVFRQSEALYAQVQGPDHPNVAFGLTSLAWAYYYHGKYDLAEEAARKALQIVEKLSAGSHYRAAVYGPLGMTLNKTGRSREAEPLLREALASYQKNTPRRSYPMAVALGSLGECLRDQKRYPEAEPLLIESYETIKSIQVPQSPALREAADRLNALYTTWGKPDEVGRYQATDGFSPTGSTRSANSAAPLPTRAPTP